jgi:hypothetical protein
MVGLTGSGPDASLGSVHYTACRPVLRRAGTQAGTQRRMLGGFLAGQGGTQLGAAYAINVPNTGVIDGVAALAQAPVALAYTSGYSSASTKVAGAVGAFGDTTAAASGSSVLRARQRQR